MTSNHARIGKAALRGMVRGGSAGALVSVATGAAVIVTIPAWVPFVATGVAIATGTVAAYAAGGAVVGAVAGALREEHSVRKEEEAIRRDFNI